MKKMILLFLLFVATAASANPFFIRATGSRYYDTNLVGANAGMIFKNNFQLSLDLGFGHKRVAHQTLRYNYRINAQSTYLGAGYSFGKLYVNALGGFISYTKNYQTSDDNDIDLFDLDYGLELGYSFNNILVGAAYLVHNGPVLKVGFLFNR